MSQLTSRGLDNTSSAFVSDLGAGKHPSPLDISEYYSPDLYLKVGFYLIKNIVPVQSYRSLKIAHSCDSCQPLYIRAAM